MTPNETHLPSEIVDPGLLGCDAATKFVFPDVSKKCSALETTENTTQ
jgi:hypothetical protein